MRFQNHVGSRNFLLLFLFLCTESLPENHHNIKETHVYFLTLKKYIEIFVERLEK